MSRTTDETGRDAAHGTVRYGFDAPGVMRGLLIAGGAGSLVGLGAGSALTGWIGALAAVAGLLALVPLGLGLSMLLYGLVGKHRMRDHMLGLVAWTGHEQVLDIGTGRGLLLIGAAKRLRAGGRATGIDVWRGEDLSGNGLEGLARNVAAEQVEDRVALRSEDARSLPFADATFDVVLSLYCIHNIPSEEGQATALREIARTLKPGGRALIGEWLPIQRYARCLSDAGLEIRPVRTCFGIALAPMWLVDATKPARP